MGVIQKVSSLRRGERGWWWGGGGWGLIEKRTKMNRGPVGGGPSICVRSLFKKKC